MNQDKNSPVFLKWTTAWPVHVLAIPSVTLVCILLLNDFSPLKFWLALALSGGLAWLVLSSFVKQSEILAVFAMGAAVCGGLAALAQIWPGLIESLPARYSFLAAAALLCTAPIAVSLVWQRTAGLRPIGETPRLWAPATPLTLLFAIALVAGLGTVVYGAPYLFASNSLPIGWDTPRYIWASRLLFETSPDRFANEMNSVHYAYPLLSNALHLVTALEYPTVQKVLPAFLGFVSAGTIGLVGYAASGRRSVGILAMLFAISMFPLARLVQDFANNLAALPLTIMAVLLLAISQDTVGPRRRHFEVGGTILLCVAAFAHLPTFILFWIIGLVNRSIRLVPRNLTLATGMRETVPFLVSVAVAALAWLPFAGTFLSGFEPGARSEPVGQSIGWLANNLNLAANFPLATLGLIYLASTARQSSARSLVLVWTFVAALAYIIPVGTTGWRAFLLIPIPLLMAFGSYQAASIVTWACRRNARRDAIVHLVVLSVVTATIVVNASDAIGYMRTRPVWIPSGLQDQVRVVNDFRSRSEDDTALIFLLENPINSFQRDILYHNSVRAFVDADQILGTFAFGGSLEALLERRPHARESPERIAASCYWLRELSSKGVFDRTHGVVILRSLNPNKFAHYQNRASSVLSDDVLFFGPIAPVSGQGSSNVVAGSNECG